MMEEIEETTSVLPFGIYEQNGVLACLLCSACGIQETHCATNEHEERLRGALERPMMLAIYLFKRRADGVSMYHYHSNPMLGLFGSSKDPNSFNESSEPLASSSPDSYDTICANELLLTMKDRTNQLSSHVHVNDSNKPGTVASAFDKENSATLVLTKEQSKEQATIPLNVVTPTGGELNQADSYSVSSRSDSSSFVSQAGDDEDMFDGMSVLQTPSPVKTQSSNDSIIPNAISFLNTNQDDDDASLIWTESLRKVIDTSRVRAGSEELLLTPGCHHRTGSLADHHMMIPTATNLLSALDQNDDDDDEDLLLFAAADSSKNDERLKTLLNELSLC